MNIYDNVLESIINHMCNQVNRCINCHFCYTVSYKEYCNLHDLKDIIINLGIHDNEKI